MQCPDLLCERLAGCLSTVSQPLIYFSFYILNSDAVAGSLPITFQRLLVQLAFVMLCHQGTPEGDSRCKSEQMVLGFCYSCITSAVGPDSSSQSLLAHGTSISLIVLPHEYNEKLDSEFSLEV